MIFLFTKQSGENILQATITSIHLAECVFILFFSELRSSVETFIVI